MYANDPLDKQILTVASPEFPPLGPIPFDGRVASSYPGFLVRWLLAIAVGLTLSLGSPASGEPRSSGILVVLSEEGGLYREAADALVAALQQTPGAQQPPVRVATLPALSREAVNAELIVPVGAPAAHAVAALELLVPVLNILIPSQVYKKIVRPWGMPVRRTFSAVFLDQPLERQLRLIQFALPGYQRLGVLSSGESVESLAALLALARSYGFRLRWETIDEQNQLLPALQLVLADSDVLLTLPDSIVLNHDTAQAILLTSYRYQDPVVAYSQAYVNAGALAAVHTTPEQAGRQTAEIIHAWLSGGNLSSPQYPKYFSVTVNYHVARSLELDVDSETALLDKLMRAEAGR